MPLNRDVVFGELRTWYKGCPDPDDLAAFARGALSSEEVDAIAAHIPNCPKCSESLDTVVEDDSLIIDLRELLHDAPPVPPRPAGSPAAKDRPCPPPERLGKYLIKEQLGQGSMGIVYRAIQDGVNRVVAIKLSSYGSVWNAAAAKRLRTECEAIGRLRHPHIVQVHEFDEHDGVPYFSMEYCGGGSLAAKLLLGHLPEREAAELVRDLALAVEYAHDHNILHRDLKPGNVLFDEQGAVRLTDFGLAKLIDTAGNETASNFILGTPSYMAPEQAAGHTRKLGPHTDVYGLGAILYACLTGKPPFTGSTSIEILKLVQTSWPARPAQLRPGLSPALESICLKCLERAPRSRYRSAKQLADDLDRWLVGQKPHASEWRRVKRIWKGLRNRAVAAGIFLMLGAGTIGAFAIFPSADREKAKALDGMYQELATKGQLTLLGPTGWPKRLEWYGPSGKPQMWLEPDGTFTVSSWGTTLLELLPDPRLQSYRIEAEMKQTETDPSGCAGLFCACSDPGSSSSDFRFFMQLSTNAITHENPRLRAKGIPVLDMAAVQLAPHLFPISARNTGLEMLIDGKNGRPIKTAAPTKTDWVSLSISITPQAVTAVVNKDSWCLAVSDINKAASKHMKQLRLDHPENLSLTLLAPSFTSRGALGIYIERAAAHFRNVKIVTIAADT